MKTISNINCAKKMGSANFLDAPEVQTCWSAKITCVWCDSVGNWHTGEE